VATLDGMSSPAPALEVVVPVYNEERDLERSLLRLRSYLDQHFPLPAVVTIADNASTDRTWDIATELTARLSGVRAVHLDQQGRGRAVKRVWSESGAAVVAYMDVDLATGLGALLPLVAPLLSGHAELAIGSRLAVGARISRGAKREFISRSYNFILHTCLSAGFSDAQCGFKAVRADVARALIPMIEDNEWFFDTEMLILAERLGLRIHEVAVDWIDDPDSRVDIARTAREDLRGVWRLMRHRHPADPSAPYGNEVSQPQVAGLVGR
jgi:glycosyltransferase involved in cell wall biosynthesis